MTKEEIVKELRKVLNAVDITFPYRLELINAIEYLLKPSLPSNLDEAAFDYAELCKYDGVDKLLCVEHFKAGSGWIAGQGETKRGVATQDHFIQFADDTYIDLDPTMKLIPAFRLKDAEEIFVQIRKKQ